MAQHFKRNQDIKHSGSGDHEESFVTIGTPLPSLNSKRTDQNVFVPIWKQEVTDEQGRRRLHGAFTGGFSAGYFNTVGSKQGWNPTEFKSSRNDPKRREPAFSQRPEDFMDEEDLAELAPSKELQTNSSFESVGPSRSHLPNQGYDPLTGTIPGDQEADSLRSFSRPSAIEAALNDLIKPNNLRAGHQMMSKMGWRDGQGIGPRITHERRILLAAKLGVDLTLDLDPEEDIERKKHLYAPIDRPLITVQPWPGTSGLGYSKWTAYSPSNQTAQGSTVPDSSPPTNSHAPKIPQGLSFGLGALNDVEDDDQDIYASASDQVTSDPRARRLLKLSEASTNIHPPSRLSSAQNSNRLGGHPAQYFQDNSALPKGFCLAPSKMEATASSLPAPPPVPDSWKPCPKWIWDAAKTHGQPTEPRPVVRHSRISINAHDRARLIGEEAPPKSVFDFISAKDKARLEEAKQLAQASSCSKVSKSEENQQISPSKGSIIIPQLDPKIAQAALRGFMPFSHDRPKQERYKLFLQSQAGMLPIGTQFSPKVTEEMTAEVVNKELDGFAKSALMFKPMSAMMASRFTSAASSAAGGELPAPEPGLRQPVFVDEEPAEGPGSETENEPSREKEVVGQAAHAVRMDMFGMMTRSIKSFFPHKLLCKRFNVPNPFPDGPPAEPVSKTSSKKLSDFLSSHGFQPAVPTHDSANSKEAESKDNSWVEKATVEDAPQSINQVGLGGDETQGREILTTIRPSIDLFKAIFADNPDDEPSDVGIDELAESSREVVSVQSTSNKDVDPTPDFAEANRQVVSLTPVVVDPKAVENLTSFRPTFLRKSNTQGEDSLKTSQATAHDKKTSKKKKRPVLISFEEDQTDGQLDLNFENKKKKRKKRAPEQDGIHGTSTDSLAGQGPNRATQSAQDNMRTPGKALGEPDDQEEDEWVEAIVPIKPSPETKKTNIIKSTPPKTYKKITRMKASDLMD